jgi:hypothetical protein
MDKTQVIVFGKTGARIFINPDKSVYVGTKHIINPDLSLVAGLPPHKWMLEDGQVVPASERVVETREIALAKEDPVAVLSQKLPSFCDKSLRFIGQLLLNGAIAYLIHKFL